MTIMEHFIIDFVNWTFLFASYIVACGLLLVMVPTVLDRTQARLRKSTFRVQNYKNVVMNSFELMRDT